MPANPVARLGGSVQDMSEVEIGADAAPAPENMERERLLSLSSRRRLHVERLISSHREVPEITR